MFARTFMCRVLYMLARVHVCVQARGRGGGEAYIYAMYVVHGTLFCMYVCVKCVGLCVVVRVCVCVRVQMYVVYAWERALACPSVCLCVRLPVCPVCLSVRLSVYVFVSASASVSVFVSVCVCGVRACAFVCLCVAYMCRLVYVCRVCLCVCVCGRMRVHACREAHGHGHICFMLLRRWLFICLFVRKFVCPSSHPCICRSAPLSV